MGPDVKQYAFKDTTDESYVLRMVVGSKRLRKVHNSDSSLGGVPQSVGFSARQKGRDG